MIGREDGTKVMCVRNLQDYFRTSIDDVVTRQQVDIDPHAAYYVVNMLTLFSRSDELYEDDGEVYGLRPLALMLADAADTDSSEERNQLLQRIGDVALFVSGFSPTAWHRKRSMLTTTFTWAATPTGRSQKKFAAAFAEGQLPTCFASWLSSSSLWSISSTKSATGQAIAIFFALTRYGGGPAAGVPSSS